MFKVHVSVKKLRYFRMSLVLDSVLALGLLVALGCDSSTNGCSSGAAIFEEVAESTGLQFVHLNGMSGDLLFLENMGAGVGLLDYDNDGDLDVYLVQGKMLGAGKDIDDYVLPERPDPPLRDRLFRNELEETGSLRFVDVTEESGIDAGEYGIGVAVGDYNNDGCPDLYLANWGPNQLWKNRCDGTFEQEETLATIENDNWSAGASFIDYDRDGWLDLYVVNYKEYAPEDDFECTSDGTTREYCGPNYFAALPDQLYRNSRDGTFESVGDSALIGDRRGSGLGVVGGDFNGDGWPDLYVANDREPNYLWQNRGDGSLQEVAGLTGTAVNGRGQALASMGVDASDFNGDGFLDVVMLHLGEEPAVLYMNRGGGTFEDASRESGLARFTWSFTGFGTLALDYDSDGMQDLFLANGAIAIIAKQRRAGDAYPLHQRNQLLRNVGSGRFQDCSAAGGPGMALSEVSRGVAVGDIDNDGDSDVLVGNNAGPVRLFENKDEGDLRWLGLSVVTGVTPRPGYGAKVRVNRVGDTPLVRMVKADGSYASSSDPRILVGLGEMGQIEDIEIEWVDGKRETFQAPPLRQYMELREGEGSSEKESDTVRDSPLRGNDAMSVQRSAR